MLTSTTIKAEVSVIKDVNAPIFFILALYCDHGLIDCAVKKITDLGKGTYFAEINTNADFSDGEYKAKAFLWSRDLFPYGYIEITE